MAPTVATQAASDAQPLFVSRDAVEKVLTWTEVVERLRHAYAVPHGPASSPRRSIARAEGVWLRCQAAAPPGGRYMGAKVFGVGREKAANHLIALFEQQSGRLAAFVDGGLATAFRTAATSAVALDRLARPGALRVGVLGSGVEACHHVEALAATRPIRALRVFSPRSEKREAFAAKFRPLLNVDVQAVPTPQAAVAGSDVVIAAARADGERPILYGEWIQPGRVVASIGSTLPEQREVDVSVIAASDLIVCDMVEEVVEETGDMLAARVAGIDLADRLLSLNDAMQPFAAARVGSARRPLYKSVGSGLQDVVVAELAVERSIAQGLARASGIHLQTRGQQVKK